jgi:hypothetical protein
LSSLAQAGDDFFWEEDVISVRLNCYIQRINPTSMRKKTLILFAVIIAIAFASASFTKDEPTYKNLKVLNKNITREEMEITMKQFKTALGVKCNHCHAASKTDPSKLDFASDDKKEKDIARSMMRMTKRINKKYFKDDKEGAISCYSCHNGSKEPKDPPKEVLED